MDLRTVCFVALLISAAQSYTAFSSEEDFNGQIDTRGLFDNWLVNQAKDKVSGLVDKTQSAAEKAKEEIDNAIAKGKEEVEKAVQTATSLMDSLTSLDACSCKGLDCQCCADLKPTKNKVCLGLALKPETLSVEYGLTLNEKPLFKQSASVKNPGAICVPVVPPAALCFRPFDLGITKDGFNACFQVELNVLTKAITSVSLNCFRLNRNSLALLPSKEPPKKGLVSFDTSKLTDAFFSNPVFKFPW